MEIKEKVIIFFGGKNRFVAAKQMVIGWRTGMRKNLPGGIAGGDFNGDGLADLAVGSQNYDDTYTDEGSVFIFIVSRTPLADLPYSTLPSQAAFRFLPIPLYQASVCDRSLCFLSYWNGKCQAAMGNR